VQCPICEITPQYPSGRSGLHWHEHWASVGVREYVTVGALGAAALGLQFVGPSPTRARWDGPILFDNPVRDLLRIDSASGRDTAATVSDALFIWEVLHPTVIDPILVAWWARESPYVAWQMMVIDAQAYALTMVVTESVKRLTARARPWVGTDDCATNPGGPTCGSGGSYLSFYSGHAATTATGAGLICAHHTQLKLYQNEWLDTGTCALAVLGTATTGAMRIASDNHWVSDVLIGHLVGYASGYLLPTLLYYKEFRLTPHDHPADKPVFAALPMVSSGSLGLTVFGLF
jgi:membrane-associated phospholipid phosphatase